MLSGPNPDFAAYPPAGKVRVTPRTFSDTHAPPGPSAAPRTTAPAGGGVRGGGGGAETGVPRVHFSDTHAPPGPAR
ncbi:hypothetical protein CHLRE_02g142446v5 [Chlamydomonas reinhardtii]|uniref:Uncharacterized protein n=1 Tax=Chlamydomonas reinhardtii TaxID=3055 RepID=A0A2K3E4E8_CHLRE|nr:uncharacterized protein CHLRE_02g142446v5 [Chlamydomonas reinhardtii]PNW87662.1 hypothetical protein CHLRE_02g142446v5 [Chlamydomonas reinhardtii]